MRCMVIFFLAVFGAGLEELGMGMGMGMGGAEGERVRTHFVTCLSRWTIGRASPARRSTFPSPE